MNGKSYIQEIHATLWGRRQLHWVGLNTDVNILVGINGSGKTTLLGMIDAYCNTERKTKAQAADIECAPGRESLYPVILLRSYDAPAQNKRSADSPLMQALNGVVNQNSEGISLFNYRMKMVDYPERAMEIQADIEGFFGVVNDMFEETGKRIEWQRSPAGLVFRQDGQTLTLSQLSSGEKQMLLLLLRVFLTEKRPAILLMDEPEISLHITWQQKLIASLRALNPQCQLIMSTHSPSIFAKGWGDKLVFIEDLCQESV